jgi:hypothetical protein
MGPKVLLLRCIFSGESQEILAEAGNNCSPPCSGESVSQVGQSGVKKVNPFPSLLIKLSVKAAHKCRHPSSPAAPYVEPLYPELGPPQPR